MHQLTQGADPDVLDAALGQLRAAGRSAPEDPDGSADEELSGRASRVIPARILFEPLMWPGWRAGRSGGGRQ
ncbi:hypothetical protein DIZ27_36525 [Streptomyces sp. NWU339]|nr:hypothetical protein DIZ27_36525 [Streptomyces sp. NWU339]